MQLNKEALGQRIRCAREEIGLNITELGERIGYSHPVIANYEHGRRRASLEFLVALSDLTGKSLDWFFHQETQFPHQINSIPKEGTRMLSNDKWPEIIKNLTDTLKLEAENMRLRIEMVESKEAEARLIAEQRQREAEHNLTLALEEARAARLATQTTPHHTDRTVRAAAPARTSSRRDSGTIFSPAPLLHKPFASGRLTRASHPFLSNFIAWEPDQLAG